MVFSLSPLLLALSFLGASAMDTSASPRLVVNLGTAADFAILTKAGVTTESAATSITGDVGTSPITFAAITGFDLTMDSSNKFSTSSIVTGNIYAADYNVPTPSKMTIAILDMQTAYVDAAGRTIPDETELAAGEIEGLDLAPGLYKWGSNVGFTNLNFTGAADAVWILQIAGSLTAREGAIITLDGGANAANIFWQVAGRTILETTAAMEGIILCATDIVFKTGSSLNGAALAQTKVTLIDNTIVRAGAP